MNQADIMNAANILAAEFVKPASNGNGYRLVSCKNFSAYLGLAEFACAGANAVDFTLEAARAQIADMLAVAVAKGSEIERTRIGAALAAREAETLTRAQKTSDEADVHREAAERLTAEAAALVAKAADLARLRELASNHGLLPPPAQETTTMHTANDFTVTPPANPVAQRDATLAMLEDIRRRLDNADVTLARIEVAAHGKDKAPRAILHPANHAAPRGYSSCGRPVEVTVGNLTAEVMVYLYTRHESDASNAPRRPVLVVVGQAWTDDASPVLNTAEWAVYSAAHPDLAEGLYEAAVDKWAGYAEQAHERALEAR